MTREATSQLQTSPHRPRQAPLSALMPSLTTQAYSSPLTMPALPDQMTLEVQWMTSQSSKPEMNSGFSPIPTSPKFLTMALLLLTPPPHAQPSTRLLQMAPTSTPATPSPSAGTSQMLTLSKSLRESARSMPPDQPTSQPPSPKSTLSPQPTPKARPVPQFKSPSTASLLLRRSANLLRAIHPSMTEMATPPIGSRFATATQVPLIFPAITSPTTPPI